MNKTRKKRSKSSVNNDENSDSPRILVIRRGIVNFEIKKLANNLRLILSPNCAIRLKEGSKQRLRDFTSVSEVLGLTHLVVLSQSSNGSYLKIANLPKGPTITFQLNKVSLISDISKHKKKPFSFNTSNYSPLLVLNGFSRDVFRNKNQNKKLSDSLNLDSAMVYVTDTLNKMISPIDLSTTKIQNCKRVILFHKQKDTNIVIFRHYSINLIDCNTSSTVKDLLSRKSMKNLFENSDFKKIMDKNLSDTNLYNGSDFDSETDEIVELENILPQNIIAKNKYGVELDSNEFPQSKNNIGIRLIEIGPRISLTLLKVQEEAFTGNVKYHKFITKTQEELEENKKMEDTIINKRKLESERVMKIYEKYVKKRKNTNSTKTSKVDKNNYE